MLPELEDVKYDDEYTMSFSYWSFNNIIQHYQLPVLFPITVHNDIDIFAVYQLKKEGVEWATLNVHPENGEKDTVMYGPKGGTVGVNKIDAYNQYPLYSNGRNQPFYEGYKATGYYKSTDFVAQNIYKVPFVLEKDVNDLYIRWEAQPDVNVTFDMNAEGMESETVQSTYAATIDRIPNPIRPGYTIDGWYTGKYNFLDEDYRWDFEKDKAYGDVTLYAKWVKTATIVSFNMNGGTPRNPIAFNKNSWATKLPEPVRENGNIMYNFLGWYDENGDEIELPLLVDRDMTLRAEWSDAIDISYFTFTKASTGVVIAVNPEMKDELPEEITLPATYEEERVYRVEARGFKDCTNITKVTLPDSIAGIRTQAFAGCSNLETVVLPDGLSQIMDQAFVFCEKLKSVNFPKGVNFCTFPTNIFQTNPLMLEQLEEVDGMKYWDTAFLGNVTYNGGWNPDNVTESITLRKGTTLMAEYSTQYNYALKELVMPDSVKYINGNVFPSNTVLSRLVLSKELEAESLQVNWPGTLTEIVLPEENENYEYIDGVLIEKEESRLAASTVGAKSIPDGVEIIGRYSFMNKPISTVDIPDSVHTIESKAFKGCQFTNIDIPDSVGVLAEDVFAENAKMQAMSFGLQTPKLSSAFFKDMSVLNTLEVDKDNNNMLTESNILYDKGTGELIIVPPGYQGDVILKEGITVIKNGTFNNNVVGAVVLPTSCKTIEDYAFRNVTMQSFSSGGVETIADYAFWQITVEGDFCIGDSVTSLGNIDFNTAKDVYIGDGVQEISIKKGRIERLHIGAGLREFNAYDVTATIENITVSQDNEYLEVVENGVYNEDKTKLYFIVGMDMENMMVDSFVMQDTVTEIDLNLYGITINRLTLGANADMDMVNMLFFEGWNSVIYLIKEIDVSPNNDMFTTFDGCLYTKDKTELIYIPNMREKSELVIAKEVVNFDKALVNVFGVLAYIYDFPIVVDTITVEEGSQLESIGAYAFNMSTDMENFTGFHPDNEGYYITINRIDLSNATKLKEIGDMAFAGLESNYLSLSLSEIILPDSVSKLGTGVFRENSLLTKDRFKVNVTAWEETGAYLFLACNGMLDSYEQGEFIIIDGVLLSATFSDQDGIEDDDHATWVLPDEVTHVASGVIVPQANVTLSVGANVQSMASGAITDYHLKRMISDEVRQAILDTFLIIVSADSEENLPEGFVPKWNGGEYSLNVQYGGAVA